MNLLSNASDAIEDVKDNGTDHQVLIKTYNQNNSIIIEIKDTGCGIPEEIMPQLFESFYTTKPPGKGTGLGLGISHSIIDSMKGKIEVTSKLGSGSTFTILIPFASK